MTCAKHSFEKVGHRDAFLEGEIWFKCRYCDLVVGVDRFWFYHALMGKGRYLWR
jgi:hypothetical protein